MEIAIEVVGKVATVEDGAQIVCDNGDYTLVWAFDEPWDAHQIKTARFVYNRKGKQLFEEVVFSGDRCAVPILTGISKVNVGVYAGNLSASTPAPIPCVKSILQGSESHTPPQEDIYLQIMREIDRVITTEEAAQLAAQVRGDAQEVRIEATETRTNATAAANAAASAETASEEAQQAQYGAHASEVEARNSAIDAGNAFVDATAAKNAAQQASSSAHVSEMEANRYASAASNAATAATDAKDGALAAAELAHSVADNIGELPQVVESMKIMGQASGRAIRLGQDAANGVKFKTTFVPKYDETKVYKYGKNLLRVPYSETSTVRGGVTFSYGPDGIITLSGTATADTYFMLASYASPIYIPVGVPITISGALSTSVYTQLVSGGAQRIVDTGEGGSAVTQISEYQFILCILSGTVFPEGGVTVYPQIEVGAQPTPWESYSRPIVPPVDRRGFVDDMVGKPGDTILTNTPDTELNCTYVKDTQKYIDKRVDVQNIFYDNTLSGLDSDNVKDALDEIVSKMGGIAKVESWEDVQKIVRLGLAPKVFKIGEQLTCNKGNTELVWDIIGFDHDVPVDSDLTHSMTLQLHDCYSGNAFDEREAIVYAESEMAAGTYNFQVVEQIWFSADNGKTFQFTLVNSVPAGGQIVLDMSFNKTLDGKNVKTYASATSTTVIETATISIGNGGTALGKSDGTVSNVNHIQRAIVGTNRWTQSAVRQWLNSTAAGNAWWQPQSVFDRPSSYSSTEGFLYDLDTDFLAVLGEVTKRTAKNNVAYGGGYEDSVETMFLISRSEIYGGNENAINEGDPYPYYSDYSDLPEPGTAADSNRIKFRNGNATRWWLRSIGYASYLRFVDLHGLIYSYDYYPTSSNGVAPACNIV